MTTKANKAEVERDLKQLVAMVLIVDESQISDSANFRDDLAADSVDCVEIVMAIEEQWNLELDEETADKLDTFGKLKQWVLSHV